MRKDEPEAVKYLRGIIAGGVFPTNEDLLAIDPWDIIDYIDALQRTPPAQEE